MRTPDIIYRGLLVASALYSMSCSAERNSPVVENDKIPVQGLPRPEITLTPTPTETVEQSKRRVGKELEDFNLPRFTEVNLPANGSAIRVDNTVFSNFSEKYSVGFNPYNLDQWLARCGIPQRSNYQLTIIMRDFNPNNEEVLVGFGVNQGEVDIDINSLARRAIREFDSLVTVSPQFRDKALSNRIQEVANVALAAGICGVAAGNEAAANKVMDPIQAQAADFVTGKLPIIAIVRPVIGTRS